MKGQPMDAKRRSGMVALAGVAFAAAALVAGASARGDMITTGELPIRGITIQRIANGQVIYTNRAGAEITKPVHEVAGLVVSAYDKLRAAEDAAAKGDHARAYRLLQKELERDRPEWLKRWIRYRLMHLAAKAGKPVEAAKRYAALVEAGVHANYLRNPPVKALGEADAEARARIRKVIASIEGKIPDEGPVADAFAELERYVGKREKGGRAPGESAIPMSSRLPDNEITSLLRRGKFEKALKRAKEALSGPTGGNMSELLYQRGLAQLGLAEKTGDEKRYKSAGLSFMRVVIHFPRSAYLGPCLLEAGRVHAAIGRPEKALELYDRARNLLSKKQDSHLVKRLRKLRKKAQSRAS